LQEGEVGLEAAEGGGEKKDEEKEGSDGEEEEGVEGRGLAR